MHRIEEARDKIIVALDVSSLDDAKILVEKLVPYVGYFKVGLELLTAIGAPQAVEAVHSLGGRVFYDGKFDDIPNTHIGATRAASDLGVEMLNLHASAGIDAMMDTVNNKGPSLVLAVTVLTSLDEQNTCLIYGAGNKAKVLQFARDAVLAGCDGIICSPQELGFLKARRELRNLLMVTPGVRPKWASHDDQKRVMTPGEAIALGADYVVIGRPIIKPPPDIGSPVDSARMIAREIALALS